MKNLIKKFDLFGHVISLNFNLKGNVHNTLIGGLLSIPLQFAFLYLVAQKSLIVYTRGDFQTNSISGTVNFEELG